MNITSVSVRKISEKNLKGFATIVLDDCFAIHNIKIIEAENRLFLSFPTQKGTNGKYYDICHPIKQETRNMITEKILAEYRK